MRNKGFLAVLFVGLMLAGNVWADNETYDNQGRLTGRTENGITYTYAYSNYGEIFETVSEGGNISAQNFYFSFNDFQNSNVASQFSESSENGLTTRTVSEEYEEGGSPATYTAAYIFDSNTGTNTSMSYSQQYTENGVQMRYDGTETYSETGSNYSADVYENSVLVSKETGTYNNDGSYKANSFSLDSTGQITGVTQSSSNEPDIQMDVTYDNGQQVVSISGDYCLSGCYEHYTGTATVNDNWDIVSAERVVTDNNGQFVSKEYVEYNLQNNEKMVLEYDSLDANTPSAKYYSYVTENGPITQKYDPETNTLLSTSVQTENPSGGGRWSGVTTWTYDAEGNLIAASHEARSSYGYAVEFDSEGRILKEKTILTGASIDIMGVASYGNEFIYNEDGTVTLISRGWDENGQLLYEGEPEIYANFESAWNSFASYDVEHAFSSYLGLEPDYSSYSFQSLDSFVSSASGTQVASNENGGNGSSGQGNYVSGGGFESRLGKRIYTVEEAERVSKPTGNKIMLRYK